MGCEQHGIATDGNTKHEGAVDYGLSPPCAEGVQPWGRPDWMAVYTPAGADGPQRVPEIVSPGWL